MDEDEALEDNAGLPEEPWQPSVDLKAPKALEPRRDLLQLLELYEEEEEEEAEDCPAPKTGVADRQMEAVWPGDRPSWTQEAAAAAVEMTSPASNEAVGGQEQDAAGQPELASADPTPAEELNALWLERKRFLELGDLSFRMGPAHGQWMLHHARFRSWACCSGGVRGDKLPALHEDEALEGRAGLPCEPLQPYVPLPAPLGEHLLELLDFIEEDADEAAEQQPKPVQSPKALLAERRPEAASAASWSLLDAVALMAAAVGRRRL